MKFDPTLYLVTDSTGRTDDDFLSILEKALTGGVTLVQLREKERGGGEYLRLARLTKSCLRPLPCAAYHRRPRGHRHGVRCGGRTRRSK